MILWNLPAYYSEVKCVTVLVRSHRTHLETFSQSDQTSVHECSPSILVCFKLLESLFFIVSEILKKVNRWITSLDWPVNNQRDIQMRERQEWWLTGGVRTSPSSRSTAGRWSWTTSSPRPGTRTSGLASPRCCPSSHWGCVTSGQSGDLSLVQINQNTALWLVLLIDSSLMP